jgi:murein DD-endopeptidase MepM/ murein hydrolase activator NlpD
MPDQTLMAALIAAALGGAEPVLPEPPPFTRYPDEAYPIVSQFGSWKGIGGGRREAPNEGVDVIARVRTPVHAAAYGVVRRVAVERERGRVVEIETTGTQPDYVMVYTHLHAATVAPGQPVRAGEPIGAVGDTGQVPRGIAFLHFELRRTDGRAVNPEPLFRSRPEGRVQCVDPERASKHPDAGGYALDRFRTTRSGAREGAPLLYPVACWRGYGWRGTDS